MKSYLSLLSKILEEGTEKSDRTGTGTLSLFGEQLKFDLAKGFPLLTTKKVHFKSIVTELLWMLQGRNDVRWLQDRGCTIWDEWQKPDGTIGPGYGVQWRDFGGSPGSTLHSERRIGNGVDQLKQLVDGLRANPDGRRHIMTAWNPLELNEMALPPCHLLCQFYVTPGETRENSSRLSCHMYQRSADIFLGVPYNIASYALLTNLLALELQMNVDKLIISFGDVHLYKNHIKQAEEQLTREPRRQPSVGICFKPGTILHKQGDPSGSAAYEPSDIFIAGYDPHPSIKAPVAV